MASVKTAERTVKRPEVGSRGWRVRFFRQWHRWIGITGALLLIFAGTTGTIVAFTEFFGPEEKLREATRKLESPVNVSSPAASWSEPVAHALATVAATAPGQPVDKIMIEFKGEHPRIQVFTGKHGGGEDRKFTIDEKTGELVKTEKYADKPFLYRLHSGEAFGDGGLVVAMMWGLTLVLLGCSGIYIYFTMRKQNTTGLKRVFW